MPADDLEKKMPVTIPGATAGNDTLNGANNQDDSIPGLAGNDSLTGLSGNDTLDGGPGIDTLVGGLGNDTYIVDVATDKVDETGGDGTDTVNVAFTLAGTYTLPALGVEWATITSATLALLIHVIGNALGNRLVGNGGNNSLSGLGGNDYLDGGIGNDTLLGGDNDDTLFGNDGTDTLSGGAGVDWIIGGAGKDTLDGGADNDVAMFWGATVGVIINLLTSTVTNDGFGNVETITNVENLHGSAQGDVIQMGNGDSYVFGEGGSDSLTGGTGHNNFIPGSGADTVSGGAGNDNVDYFDGGGDPAGPAAVGVTVNLATNSGVDSWGNTDSLVGIENVHGSAFADSISGDTNNNFIDGGAGNDTLLGGDGNDNLVGDPGNDSINGGTGNDVMWGRTGDDTLVGDIGFDRADYSDAAGPVAVSLATNTSSGSGGTDSLSGIEALTGSGFADTLTGDEFNNRLEGLGGDDNLVGNGGDDTFAGGEGNDTMDGGAHLANSFDWVDYSQATGPMTINLSTGAVSGQGSDQLSNIEAVIGSAFNDSLTGSNVSLTFFRMGAGNDTMIGNGAFDIIDYFDSPVGVTLVGSSGGSGTVTGFGNDSFSGIEGYFGSQLGDSMTGGTSSETFRVRNGAETIDGGAGTDRMDYRSTSNVVYANLETGIGQGADGNDQFRNVENLNGSEVAGSDTLIGNAGPNAIEGRAGDDTINGGGGDDSLRGGPGNDTLVGGTQTFFDFADFGGSTGPITANLSTGVATGDGTDSLLELEGVIGSPGSDSITGNDATLNWFWPGLGDDTVDGAAGDDFIAYDNQNSPVTIVFSAPGVGTATGLGSDSFSSIERVVGGNGADSFTGSSAVEVLRGGPGNDTLDGAGGNDWADYFSASSAVTVSLVTNTATGGDGTDSLVSIENISGSNSFADSLTGNAGPNWMTGRGGSDTLVGGLGDDTLDGGGGADWASYDGASSGITANLAAGTITGGAGADSVVGIEGVLGTAHADSMQGGTALVQESLEGGDGADTLDGGTITDRGGYNNSNWAFYWLAPSGVNVNLSGLTGDGSTGQGTAQDGYGDTDVLRNINFVMASSNNDTLLGSTAMQFEILEGGNGDDQLDGGAITDLTDTRNSNRISYSSANGSVVVDLAAGTATGAAGNDTFQNFNHIQGSPSADTLFGSDQTAWSEQFRAGAGNDSIDGRGGEDWIRYDNATVGVNVTLGGANSTILVADGQFVSGVQGTDTVKNIEHVRGSNLADVLTGTARTDLIERFNGLAGNDTIDGLGGVDWVSFADAPAGVSLTIGATGGGSDGYGNTDTLLNIEQVRGSHFNDSLSGSDAATLETFEGRLGNDTIDGKGGPDLADYYYAWNEGANVDLVTNVATDGHGGTDQLANIENLRGANDFGDTLLGNTAANSLDGAGGSDSINGREGNDTLTGGAGNDTLVGGIGADSFTGGAGDDSYELDAVTEPVVEAASEGTDSVRLLLAAAGTYVMPVNVEAATVGNALAVNITGNTGNNTITGGGGNNSLAGGDGDDSLFADAGNDTVDGGIGNDVLRMPNPLALYTVLEISATQLRLVGGEGENVLLGNTVETVQFFDQTLSYAALALLSGSSVADTIVGDGNANLLDGGGGNDLIQGLGSDDTLVGGTGNDTMEGGPGNDIYSVDVATDVVTEALAGGDDTVNVAFAAAGTYSLALLPNVENARITATGVLAGFNLTGNDVANKLTGHGGNNSLLGNGGDDTLDGAAGNDTLTGGAGDDLYLLNVPTDSVVETTVPGSGIDRAELAFTVAGSYTMPVGLEHARVVPISLAAINVTGNGLDNEILGGPGANSLSGLAGNDTLIGAEGNDTLQGGDGTDLVDYSNASSAITVNAVAGTVTGGDGSDAIGGFERFLLSPGNDSLLGGIAAEFIDGKGGNDTVSAGDGNDTVLSSGGSELLSGDVGTDWVDFSGNAGPVVVNLTLGSATGAGSDALAGFEGVIGTGGNDTVTGSAISLGGYSEVVVGGGGNDRIVSGGARLFARYEGGPINANMGTGVVTTSTEGTDALVGTVSVWGSPQGDTLTGSSLGDAIVGAAGNDTLSGAGGDDVALIPGPGSDSVDGGPGTDFVRFLLEAGPVNANLTTNRATQGVDTDTLAGIENLGGGDFNDTLTGDGNANVIEADPGNDSVAGLGGNDSLVGDLGNDTLDGGEGNDDVSGGPGTDSLLGGVGTDTLTGGDGNDTLDGGTGSDTFHVNALSDVVVEGPDNGAFDTDLVQLLIDTPLTYVTPANIEQVRATNGTAAINLTANAQGTILVGNDGSNLLQGGAGRDGFDGGAGNDTVLGGGDNDNFFVDPGNDSIDGGASAPRPTGWEDGNSLWARQAPAGIVLDLSGVSGDGSVGSGTLQDGHGGTDTVRNISFVLGSNLGDRITMSQALVFERASLGRGNDTVDGGAVTDTLNFRNTNFVTWSLNNGTGVNVDIAAGSASGGGGSDVFNNVNGIGGSPRADTLKGSDSALEEYFDPGSDADLVDGRGGLDFLHLIFSAGPVTLDLAAGTLVDDGSIDTLLGIEGIHATGAADSLKGGLAANGTDRSDLTRFERFSGNAGNDTIDGGQGFDIADHARDTGAVVVTLADTADGTATDGFGGTDLLRNIEGVRGSVFNDTLNGSDTAPIETFEGRAGNDRIDGNGGIDMADYRASPAGVNVNLANGTASDGWGGTDTLLDIERARGSRDTADTLTGSTGANTLEGLGGNDSLNGGDGDDRLEPGAGVDTVDGGVGTGDTLVLLGELADYSLTRPNATDLVVINTLTGENVTLRNVEFAQFASGAPVGIPAVQTGAGTLNADTLTGDTGNDLIDGLGGNDSISGLEGNDTLIGGAGIDTLVGGPGDDLYGVDVVGETITETTLPGSGTDGVNVNFAVASMYTLPANVENATVTAGPTIGVGLTGLDGANALTGNAAANSLVGLGGNDTLDGGLGNDTLVGGAGDDVYVLNVPTDIVNETAAGSSGTDRVELAFSAAGSYSLPTGVEIARMPLAGTLAINVIGNAAINSLQGNAGANSLSGLAADDELDGREGNDTLDGGEGFDRAKYGWALTAVQVDLTAGTATGGGGADKLFAIENVDGSPWDDSLVGSAVENELIGQAGNDTLLGLGANDWLVGGSGNDSLDAGEGRDGLNPGPGDDTIEGGAGIDFLQFHDAPGPVTVNLLTGQASGDGSDVIHGIEGVQASSSNDSITGDNNDNELDGLPGNDTIVGGLGSDTITHWWATAAVTVDLGNNIVTGGSGTDSLSGIENAAGTWQFNDTLTGDGAANVLDGSGGSDSLVGLGGNDTYVVDSAGDIVVEASGAGTDLVRVVNTVNLSFTLPDNVENGRIDSSGAGVVTTLIGNGVNNSLTGGSLNDSLVGGDGEDTFSGGAGNDTLDGGNHPVNLFDWVDYRNAPGPVSINLVTGVATGDGTDSLAGIEAVMGSPFNDSLIGSNVSLTFFRMGAGNDTMVGAGTFDIIDYSDAPGGINLVAGAGGSGSVTGHGNDSFSGIEGYFGSPWGDVMTGGSANETFRPRNGADTINGGDGNDRVDFRASSNVVNVNLAMGIGLGADGNDVLSNIEHLSGSDQAGTDTLIGNAGNNAIDGRIGNDSIDGADGDDSLAGGDGNDTLVGGTQGFFDYADYSGSGAAVTVSLVTNTATGQGSDVLEGIEGVIGSGLNDSITGSAAASESFRPGLGNDTVNGGDGTDLMRFDSSSVAVQVSFSAPGTGTATGQGSDVFTGIEFIVGSDGADTISGSTGNDIIRGNNGNDTLDGGAGVDNVDYRNAATGVDVNLATNLASGGNGADTLAGFEDISGSLSFADTLTGDGSANTIDGRGGNDTLNGNAGNDTLLAGTGVDTVDGGADSDTLVVLGALAAYTLARPTATDTLLVNAALGENITIRNVESVQFTDGTKTLLDLLGATPTLFADTLFGTDGQDTIDALAGDDSVQGLDGMDSIAGGSGNDTLLGGASYDTLKGGDGNDSLDGGVFPDTLEGGPGTDTLVGGSGSDHYFIDTLADVIIEGAGDTADAVWVGLAASGNYILGPEIEQSVADFSALAAVITLTGNAKNNFLRGHDGNDLLIGAEGNDTMYGRDAGVDTMSGGPGDDAYIITPSTVITELAGGGIDTIQELRTTVSASYTLPANVENLAAPNTGSSVAGFVLTITGNGEANNISGSPFKDVITGLVGNDTLAGRSGNDSLNGGVGDDSVTGEQGDDTLLGDLGNDTLSAGVGVDSVDAGDGIDLLQLAGSSEAWLVTRPTATQVLFSGATGSALVSNVENVQFGNNAAVTLASLIATIGSPGNDTLTGDVGADVVSGGAGLDLLGGGPGNDSLLGGAGNDTLAGGAGADILDGGDGSDTYALAIGSDLELIEQNDPLLTNIDVVQLAAGITAADLSFSRGYNTWDDLVITVQSGGTLQQVVVVDFYSGESINPGTIDQLKLASGQVFTAAQMAAAANAFDGGNHVFVGFSGNDSLVGDVLGVAADWAWAGSGNDTLTGLAGADTLFGDNGNDSMSGGADNDRLAGAAGNDTLDGGAGSDVLSGGAGGDTYLFGLGSGQDLLTESLVASDWASSFDSGAGPVYTTYDGDQARKSEIDTLLVGAGVLPSQMEATRSGNTLRLHIATTSDEVLVADYFANGVPTIERIQFANGTVWTSSVVRTMVLQPTAGNDTLIGYTGADVISGGNGNDLLTGNAGADRFVFNLAPNAVTNIDTITDFTPGSDKIVLSKAVFSALVGAPGALLDPDTDANVDYNSGTGALTYDADGGGAGAAVTVAILGLATHPAALGLDVLIGT